MVEQGCEFKSIGGVDLVIVHYAQGIIGLHPVQTRQRPPSAADGVEVASPAPVQPIDLGELRVDDLTRFFQAAARSVDQAQAAEGKRGGLPGLAVTHVDQLEAAASEITDDAIGAMDAGDDAQGSKLGLLPACEHMNRCIEGALGLRYELRPVLRLARRRRGKDLDPPGADLVEERAKASKRPERPGDGVGGEPPGRGERAPEAAQHLLVEQRARSPGRTLIDDEPNRVRSDVDYRDGAQFGPAHHEL